LTIWHCTWTPLSSIKQQREVFKVINGIGVNYFEFKRINHGMNTSCVLIDFKFLRPHS